MDFIELFYPIARDLWHRGNKKHQAKTKVKVCGLVEFFKKETFMTELLILLKKLFLLSL